MQKILSLGNVGIDYLQYLVQRVATNEEAEQMILQGWKFVGMLPNGKVVLEKRGFDPTTFTIFVLE